MARRSVYLTSAVALCAQESIRAANPGRRMLPPKVALDCYKHSIYPPAMRRIALALLFATMTAYPQASDDARKLTGMTVVFSVDLPLDVPGAVLQPGTYVLRLKREPGRTGDLAQLQLWDAT